MNGEQIVSKRLSLVHLQLTGKCNLHCFFCGQWGENGYSQSESAKVELSTSEWIRVIDEILAINTAAESKPEFILWGGEPLLSPAFKAVVMHLHALKCKTSIVTNGILLEQNINIINNYVATLCISVDGSEFIHDQLRGKAGVYRKIETALKRIDRHKVTTVCMTTICESNVGFIKKMPFTATELGFKKIILQNLIYCSAAAATNYKNWLKANYNQSASQVSTWIIDEFEPWFDEAYEQLQLIKSKIEHRNYPIEVVVHPIELLTNKGVNWYNYQVELCNEMQYCKMPFEHLQITAKGEANFCVDFCDFSLGNIKDKSLDELWNGDMAEKFRQDILNRCNPLCRRCPWLYNRQLKVD